MSPHFFKKKFITKTNKTKLDFNTWTLSAYPAKCHQSTSLRILLGHAFANTYPSIPNMTYEGFYLLPCCFSFSCCSCSCCHLQAPAKISARWRYRPPITNLTAHHKSQFGVSFNFFLTRNSKNASRSTFVHFKHVWWFLLIKS